MREPVQERRQASAPRERNGRLEHVAVCAPRVNVHWKVRALGQIEEAFEDHALPMLLCGVLGIPIVEANLANEIGVLRAFLHECQLSGRLLVADLWNARRMEASSRKDRPRIAPLQIEDD